jgi:hypothetical protein
MGSQGESSGITRGRLRHAPIACLTDARRILLSRLGAPKGGQPGGFGKKKGSGMRRSSFALVAALVLPVVVGGPTSSPAAALDLQPTTTVFLPNIVKMLGGEDGWQTPFIVQNVGAGTAALTFEFYRFSDGALIKTRNVSALAPGTSVFHSPNHDAELAAGGQYSVVVKSFGSPVVAVVNEHQSQRNPQRQEALSYDGLATGSTKVYLPYVAAVVTGWYCTVIAQNLGTGFAAVIADFKSFDGSKVAQISRAVPPRGSKFIDPRFEPSLVSGTEYAVALTATQPIGVVVNCHDDDPTVAAPRAFSYDGVAATSESTIFLPHVQRNVQGSTTRLLVQNVGIVAATPTLRFRRLGFTTEPIQAIGPSLQPGATWSSDLKLNVSLADGEYSLTVAGGQFAVLGATTATTSASGATGTGRRTTKLYLPNITRTLGGAQGWTTPINLQSTGAENATLRWYRFADGALVYTQLLLFAEFGQTIRVDPRSVPALTDDTQYGVVVTSESGGVSASVSELSFMGGDGSMSYEGVPQPPTAAWGTSYCQPDTAPAGTNFQCVFAGLTPGAAISNITFTRAGSSSPDVENTTNVVGADGVFHFRYYALATGQYTAVLSSGGMTQTATFNVTPRSFPLTISSSSYGAVVAATSPGLPCSLVVELPNGTFQQDAAMINKIADPAGKVSWTYTKQPGVAGNGFNIVYCTSGSETPVIGAPFTAP